MTATVRTLHADRLAAMSDAELIEDAIVSGPHCIRCCPVCRIKPWRQQSPAEKFLSACYVAAVAWGVWQTLRGRL